MRLQRIRDAFFSLSPGRQHLTRGVALTSPHLQSDRECYPLVPNLFFETEHHIIHKSASLNQKQNSSKYQPSKTLMYLVLICWVPVSLLFANNCCSLFTKLMVSIFQCFMHAQEVVPWRELNPQGPREVPQVPIFFNLATLHLIMQWIISADGQAGKWLHSSSNLNLIHFLHYTNA